MNLNKKIAVILVDDDPLILDVLRINVERSVENNAEVICASSGPEALELIQELITENEYYIGVILSDFLMPKMLGSEFLLKADSLLPHSKKIMLTGQAEAEKIINLLCEMEMFRFITKPWNPQTLITQVKKALDEFVYFKTLELNQNPIRANAN
jgi:response regulator RpfG family c-di-GMP phosphodiesterase